VYPHLDTQFTCLTRTKSLTSVDIYDFAISRRHKRTNTPSLDIIIRIDTPHRRKFGHAPRLLDFTAQAMGCLFFCDRVKWCGSSDDHGEGIHVVVVNYGMIGES